MNGHLSLPGPHWSPKSPGPSLEKYLVVLQLIRFPGPLARVEPAGPGHQADKGWNYEAEEARDGPGAWPTPKLPEAGTGLGVVAVLRPLAVS